MSGTTNASGVFTTTLSSTLAQTETITASENGVQEATSATFVAGAPSAAKSSIVASPGSLTADGVSTTTLTVTVEDADGNAVANTAVTLSASGANNTFGAMSGTTNASGVFTTTLASTLAQTETITASENGVQETTSATFTAGAPIIKNIYNSSGVLIATETIEPNGSYDIRYYTAGTFDGAAYASYDNAYTAANVRDFETFFDVNGNVVATDSFAANGGYTVTVGGTLTQQKTVNADGSYDIRYYTAGTFDGAAYASYDNAYTAANVRDFETFYNASNATVATVAYSSDGTPTITLVADTSASDEAAPADGRGDQASGTDSGVQLASFVTTGDGPANDSPQAAPNQAEDAHPGTTSDGPVSVDAIVVAIPGATAPGSAATLNTMTGAAPFLNGLAEAFLVGGIVLPAAIAAKAKPSIASSRGAHRAARLSTFDLLEDRFESVYPDGEIFDLPSATHSDDSEIDWEVLA
jgi:hypothetical protein